MAKRRPFETDVEDEPQRESAAPVVATASAPPTLKEAFDQLRELEAMPARTDSERSEKAKRLAAQAKLCGDLQQGLPVLNITADGYSKAHGTKVDDLRMTRLRSLARTNLDVAWYLQQHGDI